jgi:hypothetical protein
MLIVNNHLENAEKCYTNDVVVIFLGFALYHCSFSVIATSGKAKQEERRGKRKVRLNLPANHLL